MTTLADIRTALRLDLKDTDAANYRWTDAELDRHVSAALKELSRAIPREQKATLATTAGSRQVSIASLGDIIELWAVEYPTGVFPAVYQSFSLFNQALTLLSGDVPNGSNCFIYFGAAHTLDGSGSTLPGRYEDLLTCGASAYALLEYAAYSVNRVNLGGAPSPGEFRIEGERRLKLFKAEVRNHSSKNRVRVSRMYAPSEPVRSKTTDWGRT